MPDEGDEKGCPGHRRHRYLSRAGDHYWAFHRFRRRTRVDQSSGQDICRPTIGRHGHDSAFASTFLRKIADPQEVLVGHTEGQSITGRRDNSTLKLTSDDTRSDRAKGDQE